MAKIDANFIKHFFSIYNAKSHPILYSACHEQNVLLKFQVFQQSCTSGLWLSSQRITSYPLNILLNLFWSCFLSDFGLAIHNRLIIISILIPFVVRYWYQCYTIYVKQIRDCISFFYSPEKPPWIQFFFLK